MVYTDDQMLYNMNMIMNKKHKNTTFGKLLCYRSQPVDYSSGILDFVL